jgi:galactokinase
MNDFQTFFGRRPTFRADAPGRVNLIGEHTDYNGGFVLPTPIPQRTMVDLAPRDDVIVCAVSENVSTTIEEYRLGSEQPGRGWLDYVQGVTQLLSNEGHKLCGFDVHITSDIPIGSGLSSSAALTVSLMRALRAAFHLQLDDVQIARTAQRVENEFVGAQVGIMDPMVCSLGDPEHALFIDARSQEHRRVPLPKNAELVVINSGLAHQHSAGDYNTRRAECERACALLGIRQLRDLTLADLPRLDSLPEVLKRRARHVVTENARVLASIEALKAGNLMELGRLFYASHQSQRDNYQVSIAEIDLLVDLAREHSEVYGARLTGGGFGGSIVVLVKMGRGCQVSRQVTEIYGQRTKSRATILLPRGHE